MNLLDLEFSRREIKSTIEAFNDELHNDSSEEVKVFTYFNYGDTLCIVQCFVEGKCYLTDISSEITEASLALDALYYQLYLGLHPKVIDQYIHRHTKNYKQKKSFQYYKKACLVEFQR